MSDITAVFKPNHKALIAYLTVGYPSMRRTLEIVPQIADWGCDIVELGIPFSDPLADGSTIQEASFQALKHGTSVRSCLDMVRVLRKKVNIPLVFMSYYNPILSFGLESLCHECQQAGVDGLIIPDLPPEEATDLEGFAGPAQLDLIYLLAPNSTEERISLVAKKSQGFIYLVSLTGVTGARRKLPADLETFVSRVRRKTTKPLCVGFGVSTAEEAQRIARIADGVIVGSRLVQLLGQQPLVGLTTFVTSLRNALDNPGL